MFKIITYNLIFLFFLFFLFELILKSYFPRVHGGVYYNFDNNIKTIPSLPDPYILKKNKKFIHKSNEFNSIVTSTDYGNRVSNEIDVAKTLLFIGDSFTYGHGVSDNETFAYLYCTFKKIRCVNLGKPGTDQGSQFEILKTYLNNVNVEIYNIKLFLFISCNLNTSGNDIMANLKRYNENFNMPSQEASSKKQISSFNISSLIHLSKNLIYKSEILKRISSIFISQLKSNLQSCSDINDLDKAFSATKFYIDKITEMAKMNNATIKLFAILPYYELQNASSKVLMDNYLKPENLNISIINNLLPDHYYKFDGHLNKIGHKKIHDYLLKNN